MRLLYIFIAVLILSIQNTAAQTKTSVKYYDSSWQETPKTSAFYFTEYLKMDTIYKATSNWVNSGKLKYIIFYTDTSFNHRTGVSRKYYESGQIEDSGFYNAEGKIISSYYFYPNGKVWVHYP